MSSHKMNERSRPRRKKREKSPLPWFFAFLVLITGVLVYFLYFDQLPPQATNQGKLPTHEKTVDNRTGSDTPQPQEPAGTSQATVDVAENSQSDQADGTPSTLLPPVIEASSENSDSPATSSAEMLVEGQPEMNNVDMGPERICTPSVLTIKDFYAHLDQQEYLIPYQLDKPSEQYFSNLLQKVVDNPPIVTGETDDLFSILQNTAHFFRIVGKKNIFTLKAILDREKDSFENVLAEFYKLTDSPVCLEEGFGLNIPESALYDYAGFFLNTMGGRLYLFRRDSVSRLAVSYYSILIVDKANSSSTNKHGIDIGPAIRSLIDELENSGSRLRLRDDYLDKLYSLEEKYM